MKIHAFNCASFHPLIGGPATHQDGRGYLSTRCLVVEHDHGILLVDTGFGAQDIADPGGRLGLPFLMLARPRLDPDECLEGRLRRLGIYPSDVKDILITHLDLDHAGGLAAFPEARVHLHAAELRTAEGRPRGSHRLRYVPEQWAHGPRWAPFEFGEERWEGLPAHTPAELPAGIRMVSLPGHSPGHCGVVIEQDNHTLLHAGDAYMEVHEICVPGHRISVATRAHHAIFDDDSSAARTTRQALRELVQRHPTGLHLVNAHDPHELRPDGTVGLQAGLDAVA